MAESTPISATDAANLLRALDNLYDRLIAEDRRGFEHESERLQFYFDHVKQKVKRWSRKHPCMFPGCGSMSIKRSHAIPASSCIQTIAEAGHVIKMETFKGEVRESLVGIREASVFPGFCEDHEKVFQSFEKRGHINTAEELSLQCLRTVCREVRLKEAMVRHLCELQENHRQMLRSKGLRIFTEVLGEEFMKRQPAVELAISLDSIDQAVTAQVVELNNSIQQYKNDFMTPILKDLETGEDCFWSSAIQMDFQLPVCLAGRGNFFYKVDEQTVLEAVAILHVLPSTEGTKLFLTVPVEHKVAATEYISKFSRPEFNLVSMVESWMMHGSDHWFVKPSVWHTLGDARKAAIYRDILDTSRNIGFEYAGSIFNNLRNQLISENAGDKRAEVRLYIEQQAKKLRHCD